MDISNKTVTINGNDCELKTCWLADKTGVIALSLWDAQIELVETGKSYSFTNLSTRKFSDNTTLTTTRTSTFTPILKNIPEPATTHDMQTPPPTLHTISTEITGAAITVKKQCPKCHTPQHTLSSKDNFHRCSTCKILRKGTSYITRCSGFVTIQLNSQETSLSITNSLLTQFINQKKDVSTMDNQDIEEYFMMYGPLTLTFTDNNQLVHIQTPTQKTEEINNSDEELSAIIIEIPKDHISDTEQTSILSPQKSPQKSTHDNIAKKKQKTV